jgi:hypothetical protein
MTDYLRLVDEALAKAGLAPDGKKLRAGTKYERNEITHAKRDNTPCGTRNAGINSFISYFVPPVDFSGKDFAAGFQKLQYGCPKGVDNPRYVEALADAELFLAQWGATAEAFGWPPEDLFGLDPVAPLRRYDRMGLIWLLRGRPVVALTASTATIRIKDGGALTFYRQAGRRP